MPAQFTLPPDTRSVGSGNPPADMNAVVDAVTAMGAGYNVLNAAFAGGADPAGTSDSAAAFNAAQAAIPAAGGFIYLPAGTYKLASTAGPFTTNQWVICAPGVVINWTGTGGCFRFTDASTYTTRTKQGGGIIGRPVIDGAGDGAGSCAVHAGDILGLRIDVAAQNFSKAGDAGVHFDNQVYWSEQAVASIWTNNCTQDVVFDCGGATTSAGSYDRGDFTIYVQHTTFTGDSIVFQNGAYLVGGRLRLFGNYASSSSSFTQAVLKITGSAPGGHPASDSGLAQCEIDINVESDGGLAHTFQTVNYGSTSNTIVNCSGNMSFGAGFLFATSNVTTLSTQFTYLGPVIGDGTLAQANLPGRLSVNSSAFFFSSVFFGGITGATTGFRLAGATASGAPASGTFSAGDVITAQDGTLWTCVTAGTPGTWMPLSAVNEAAQQYGYLGWTYDPAMGSGGTVLPTAGGVILCKIPWPLTQSVTNVVATVVAGGGTLTSGQCFAGLYSSSGTRLGVTADQASAWGTAGTVPKTMAITGGPVSVPGGGPAGFIYAGFLWNGTTAPQFLKASNSTAQSINGALPAASLRTAVNGSGGTSLPSSLTLSSSTAATNLFWAAVS
jgi:hypothetical protein